ncbi:TPA: hypothetical protein R6W23_002842 [Citrobacter gillenii]|nr:hypothetical protein [Citrobacter gillenii]
MNGIDSDHYLYHVLNDIADWLVLSVNELLPWRVKLSPE